MPDHLVYDEGQEFLGEDRIKPGIGGKRLQPGNLCGFAGFVGWRQVVFRFQTADGLGVGKAFRQCIDQDRIETIDAVAMFGKDLYTGGTL